MRRQPKRVPLDFNAGTYGQRPPPRPEATNDAGRLTPFLVSGGRPTYLLSDAPPFDPRAAAVQLLCAVYINKGDIGFLKSIRVAPYMPALYGPDPVNNSLLRWRVPDSTTGTEYTRPASTAGLWETPAGWEAYFDAAADPPGTPPIWRWHLRIIQGNIDELRESRRNVPEFALGNQPSYFLVPDIPVPAATYSAGLPGKPVGYPWPGNRFQALPGDPLYVHIPIDEDSTLCLFAEWYQQPIAAYVRTDDGIMLIDEFANYPLLPSYGQLCGYSLTDAQPEAIALAKTGW